MEWHAYSMKSNQTACAVPSMTHPYFAWFAPPLTMCTRAVEGCGTHKPAEAPHHWKRGLLALLAVQEQAKHVRIRAWSEHACCSYTPR
eukprot:6198252-Pleurochrysis_carterae.AAC.5